MCYFYWKIVPGVFFRFEYDPKDYQSYIVARQCAYRLATDKFYLAPRVISVNH